MQLSTGVELRYVEQGSPGGEAVLFLHGYTDSHHSFDLSLPHLPSRYRAYALDQRGHGDSQRPACCYTQQDFAADVAAFMDAMRISRATLVGHSMGSFIAQQVALAFPQRVEALVLIGSAPTGNNAVIRGLNDFVVTLEDPVDPGFVHEFQASTVFQPVPDSYLNTLVSESLKVPARVWKDALAGLIAEDHSARLGQIAAPTLIVGGDQDSIFSVAEQQALAAAIPGARLVLYPQVGHAPHAEVPQRFVKDLTDFLHAVR
ncbi:alpha/beta fold hydrolase [Hyalangium rubrum]|uniref:Alpha/beta hydrolase n=1 Tax=Hyalangium rubrum TaxID=3103134 RepID=A0ABU5GZ00_9BACT|nr:alpha/beta hydrolase [Hyalangium sp. s54d21]MDY7226380.1 alpha/beta hydrolase [Hyalangium sp. s54d21]